MARGSGTRRGEATRRRILGAIVAYRAGHPRPPTLREAMGAAGVRSTGQMAHHVKALVDRGYLEKAPGTRGLIVTEAGRAWLEPVRLVATAVIDLERAKVAQLQALLIWRFHFHGAWPTPEQLAHEANMAHEELAPYLEELARRGRIARTPEGRIEYRPHAAKDS